MPLTRADARQAVIAIEAQIDETLSRLGDDPSLLERLDLMLCQRSNYRRFAAENGS